MHQWVRPTRLLWLAGLTLWLAGPPPAFAQATSGSAPLTLGAAIDLALARNDRVVAARDEEQRATIGVRIARAAFNPKVVPSLSSSLGQTDLANQNYGVAVSQQLTSGTELRFNATTLSSRNQFGTFYAGDTTFLVRQPLLRGFGRAAAREPLTAAEARVDHSSRDRAFVEQTVALDVAGAYFDLIKQKQLAVVARQSLARTRQLADASAAKLTLGRASQLDVLRARQLAGQGEAQLLAAADAVDDAQDRLRLVMGMKSAEPMVVPDAIPPIATVNPLPEDLVGAAWSTRVDVRNAEASVTDSTRAINLARSQLRPQADLSLGMTRQIAGPSIKTSFGVNDFRLATFATVSMPLDRTAEDAALQTAVLERDRRQRDLDMMKTRVEMDVRKAARAHDRALKTLELEAAALDLAARELDVAKFRYERGLATSLDLVAAESNLVAAEGRRIAASADVALSQFALRAAVGILDPRTDMR
jgi:outer membrane protein TolC